MIKSLTLAIIGIGCPLLWAFLLMPLLARVFGLRMKMAFVREPRSNNHLSRLQHVFAWGVLSWGLAMFLFLVILESGDSLLTMHPFAHTNPVRVAYALSICVISGALFGVWDAPKSRRPSATNHLSE